MPVRPLEVPAPEPPRCVHAVVPCYNRPRDAELLLNDLAEVAASEPSVDLRVLLVDNASDEPLAAIPVPAGLRVEHVRLEENRGGSGGFNAGIARVLFQGVPCDDREFIWILDSDARVGPGTLGPLIRALDDDEELVAVGSALADERGVYELGGSIDRATGELRQQTRPPPANGAPVPAEYAAACSLLVRRWAVERAGPMVDVFVSGDDVEWCLRLARATGGRVAVAPASVARHPRPDRMRTWARYYAARNAFVPIGSLGLGARVRFRRAIREVGRALAQTMMGRDDLAALHLRGLEHAAAGATTGPGPASTFEAFHPLTELGPALKPALAGRCVRRVRLGRALGVDAADLVRQLRRLALEPAVTHGVIETKADWRARAVWRGLRRLLLGPPADLAVVSARGRPEDWLAGRTLVTIAPEGFVIRRIGRAERLGRVLTLVARGTALAVRIARRGVPPVVPAPIVPRAGHEPAIRAGTVSTVILSHNRREVLERTLERIRGVGGGAGPGEVIVVDNASTDGTPERLEGAPGVTLLPLTENTGVAGYNVGVERATGDYVLILDDDSWPDEGAVERAARLLDRRPDLAAVALNPRHPATDAAEWPFAESMGPRDDWPIMGCGNLVRRDAWRRVGGYEPAFFLYRNDTDLALKLLGAGLKVHFDPRLVVRHDSPAARRKPLRWFRLATRNWVWLCRRHGRGVTRVTAILGGWLWAHRLAGVDPRAHWSTIRGLVAGLFHRAPRLPESVTPTGRDLGRALRIRA